MLTGVQQMKAAREDMASHPSTQFQPLQDGFGNSLQRAKPFVEHGGSSRSKRARDKSTSTDLQVVSFPKPKKKKKATMQSKLDDLAANNESDGT